MYRAIVTLGGVAAVLVGGMALTSSCSVTVAETLTGQVWATLRLQACFLDTALALPFTHPLTTPLYAALVLWLASFIRTRAPLAY